MRKMLRESLTVHADRISVVLPSAGESATYRELEDWAVGIEDVVSDIDPDVLVIALEKSPAYYAAIVACLIRGRSFCFVDEATPPARLHQICTQFQDPLLLHGESVAELTDVSSIPASSIMPRRAVLKPNALVSQGYYYVATSGSSGTPKLIRGKQSSLASFAAWSIPFYGVNVHTRWAQFSNTGFDLTLVDIISVLSTGGALVAMTSRFERLVPTRAIADVGVTHWHSVPSAIPHLLKRDTRQSFRGPLVFTFCGEPLYREPVSLLRQRYPGARVINTYGPTEGTLFFMAHEVTDDDLEYESMPLGQPIPGWRMLLKPTKGYDEFECIIMSDLVADGYVGESQGGFGKLELDGSGTRTFATGDIMTLKEGRLFFSRRQDQMVKIKGVRIDLGEVESVARSAGSANPIAFKDADHLHLVIDDVEGGPSVAQVEALFDEQLGKDYHPHIITVADSLPRNANGKIDRNAARKRFERNSNE